MAKIKKTFDRDSMYKKIMPTTIKKDIDQRQAENNEVIEDNQNEDPSIHRELFFQNKEINIIKEQRNEVILYNITEKLVLNKLDATLRKMNCCRCDRCKKDIVAIALNNLKPMYIVATKEQIKQKICMLGDMGSEVTTEVIKAVLDVRKNPRH